MSKVNEEDATVKPEASKAGAGFPGNPFDFSSMAEILNDPGFRELGEQIIKDPSFTQMAEKLQLTFHGGDEHEFGTKEYHSMLQQVMQNQQLQKMAERLGSVMMHDESMSHMRDRLSNQTGQFENRMRRIKDTPVELILKDIKSGGPTAMMRYCDSQQDDLKTLGEAMGLAVTKDALTGYSAAADEAEEDVLKKLGEAMGLAVTEDATGISAAADAAEEDVNEDVCILHRYIVAGDHEGLGDALSSGADKEEKDRNGKTALHVACELQQLDCVFQLVDAGAMVNALDDNNNTPLHYAVALRENQIICYLRLKGAVNSLQNINGHTPVDLAKLQGVTYLMLE